MIYLLDVNVLVAMKYVTHVHHARATRWFDDLGKCDAFARLATCSITEIGFVRVAASKRADLAADVSCARRDLAHLKEHRAFTFLGDSLGADHLPLWATRSKHVTDGHLLSLAKAWGSQLVTLDGGIPGAILIADRSGGPMMVREPTVPYRVGSPRLN